MGSGFYSALLANAKRFWFDTPKVQTLPPYPEKEVVVPEGHAWVEGDESFRTWDSNKWGPVRLRFFRIHILL